MAKNNNQAEHGSSIVAMISLDGTQPVPFNADKQTGIQHALADGRVDTLARQLSGQPVSVVLKVLGA